MTEIEERGSEAVIADAIAEALDGPEVIYLSVDIDVLDPGLAPGTGTPEPGGMLTRELLRAVRQVVSSVELAAMDVVEVAPPYDHAEVTAAAAHRCVLEALSALAARRRDASVSADRRRSKREAGDLLAVPRRDQEVVATRDVAERDVRVVVAVAAAAEGERAADDVHALAGQRDVDRVAGSRVVEGDQRGELVRATRQRVELAAAIGSREVAAGEDVRAVNVSGGSGVGGAGVGVG